MTEILQLFGISITAIGVFMAYQVLKSNHDWYRRKYSLDMLREWNEKVIGHAKEIEKFFPTLLDVDKKKDGIELTRERAIKIYTCTPDHPDWNLRYHIYELLNHFEFVATAYFQGITDVQIIEQSFKEPLLRYHDRLSKFISIVEERRGHQPWPPYIKLINKWNSKEVDEVRRNPDE